MPDELKILMLEDEPADAELAVQALREAGIVFSSHRVDTRDSFVAALEAFRPDIVLADYRLPGFGGLEALAIASEQAPDVPFVFVSGTMGEEFAIETLRHGASDYVIKNRLGKLAPAVLRALQEAEERRLRHQAEAELAASEERFRRIAESIQDGMIIVDQDSLITYWNRAAERMFDYASAEALGRSWYELLTPVRFHDMFRQASAEFRETGQGPNIGRTVELAGARKGGEEFPVEASFSSVLINGRWHGTGIVRDISERRRAEAVNRKYAAIVESSDDAIIGMTTDGFIDTWSRGAAKVYGYAADEIVGRSVAVLAPDGRQHEVADLLAAVHAGKSVAHYETSRKRKDGRQIDVSLSLSPIRNSTGKICGISAIDRDITERKAAEKEIEYLAYYDSLTRLPNRRLLVDRLRQALAGSTRSRRKGAILFIDLDNFKIINNTSGHDVGDKLLIEVARRVAACVRDGDTIARLGADEFVVMLEGLSESSPVAAAQAKSVGEKILAAIDEPYLIADREHHCTPSIGVTLFTDSECAVDELLKQANIAMNQAKSAGRNTLRFFDPEMQVALAGRALLEAALRLGIQHRQFVLHYQPQVDRGGAIIGAEALLRWEHPERGMVSPAQFIPLAEETGLILPIGQWVLETACAQLKAWAGDSRRRDLHLSINVSARQFRQVDFVDKVRLALGNGNTPTDRLKLELTESLVLDDIEDTIEKMRAIKQLGVGFSMDDFGTGYSSLAYLTRLPLDQLKIDRSFVRNLPDNPNDAVIAQTIITMAKSLGLSVIAEGVETEAQRQFLERHGCPDYQGYLFSKPVALAAFEELLTSAQKKPRAIADLATREPPEPPSNR
jgi:diguanylate cyclase (GGDEF)-like protein/PAS domain S-box-containing protein